MKNIKIDKDIYSLEDGEIVTVAGNEFSHDSVCGACNGEIYDGDTLVVAQYIDPKDERRLEIGIVHTECDGDTNAEMFLTPTTSKHEWTSATEQMIREIEHIALMDNLSKREKMFDMNIVEQLYLNGAKRLRHSRRDIIAEAMNFIFIARTDAEKLI